MKIVILILAYTWVAVLHSFLVGTFVFAWFGKKFKPNNSLLYALIIFCVLLFFESYWVPIFNYLKLNIYIIEPSILSKFNLTANTNLVEVLKPGIFSVSSCILQTLLAMYIGKKYLQKINAHEPK